MIDPKLLNKFIKVCERAAFGASKFKGKNDKIAADKAAVDEMRSELNKIDFKNNSRNRFYIYTKEKLKIKCERIFEINPDNKVVGFTSKNCF